MIRRLGTGLVLATLLSFSAPALAGIQDFTIRNNGKFAIWYIFVSPTTSDEWEEDILGEDVMPANSELNVEMTGYDNQCMFDIKIIDERENVREYYDVDLCTVLYVDFP